MMIQLVLNYFLFVVGLDWKKQVRRMNPCSIESKDDQALDLAWMKKTTAVAKKAVTPHLPSFG